MQSKFFGNKFNTPSNKCEICEELHFAKSIKFLTRDLEKKYLSLTSNDRSFSTKKICASCKRALQNRKLTKFATPEQIRRNVSLPVTSTLSELEERLVSLRIAFAQIRQWGYK